MTTINVKDAAGSVVAIEKPLPPGRSSASASRPVALSSEDLSVLSSVDSKLSSINFNTDTLETALGILAETAPASDTAASGLNGRMQRIAQRLTSLIALFPGALGASGGLKVDGSGTALPVSLASVPSHAVTNAGTFAVQASLAAGSNVVGKVGIDQTTDGTTNLVAAKQSGSWTIAALTAITNALPAGTNAIGKLAANSGVVIGAVENNTTAATGGIASTSRIVSAAATTNGTSAKASAGRVYAIQGYNASTSVRYLKFYNKASAPTVGTDTPIKTLALPPGAAFAFDFPLGYSFSTGIAYALTTGSSDGDTGALTLADVLGLNVDYV